MNFSADSKVLASGSNHLLPIDITYETTDPYVRIPPQTNADTFTDSNYLTWEVPTSTNWTTKWNKSYFHVEFEVKVSENGDKASSRYLPNASVAVASQGFLHDLIDDLTIQGAGQSEIRNINASSGSYQFASKVLELLETNSRRVGSFSPVSNIGVVPTASVTASNNPTSVTTNRAGTTAAQPVRISGHVNHDCPNPFVLCLSPDMEDSDHYCFYPNPTEPNIFDDFCALSGYQSGVEYRRALLARCNATRSTGTTVDDTDGVVYASPYRPKDGWFSNPIGMFNNAPLRLRMRRGATAVAFTGNPYNDYRREGANVTGPPGATYKYEVYFTRFDLMLYRHQLTSTSVNTIKQNILQAGKVRYPMRYVNVIQRPVLKGNSNLDVPLFESSAADLVIVAFVRQAALNGLSQGFSGSANVKWVDSFKCAPRAVRGTQVLQNFVPIQQRTLHYDVAYQNAPNATRVNDPNFGRPSPLVEEIYLLVDGVRTYNTSYTPDDKDGKYGDPEGYLTFIREVAPHYPDLINYFSQMNWDNNIRLFAWNLTTDGEMVKNQGSDLVNRKQIQLVTRFHNPQQNDPDYTMVAMAITNQAILEADAAGNMNLLR